MQKQILFHLALRVCPQPTTLYHAKRRWKCFDPILRWEQTVVVQSQRLWWFVAWVGSGRLSSVSQGITASSISVKQFLTCRVGVEFARQHKSFFDSVWWLDGSSRSSLQQSLAESASRALGILVERDFTIIKAGEIPVYLTQNNVRDISTQFLSWLSEGSNRNWLVVYDNVDRDWTQGHDNDAYNIKDFLPDCDHGNTLVTTRLSHLLRSKKRLRLDRVNDEQARRILEARAGKVLPGKSATLTVFSALTVRRCASPCRSPRWTASGACSSRLLLAKTLDSSKVSRHVRTDLDEIDAQPAAMAVGRIP